MLIRYEIKRMIYVGELHEIIFNDQGFSVATLLALEYKTMTTL